MFFSGGKGGRDWGVGEVLGAADKKNLECGTNSLDSVRHLVLCKHEPVVL